MLYCMIGNTLVEVNATDLLKWAEANCEKEESNPS